MRRPSRRQLMQLSEGMADTALCLCEYRAFGAAQSIQRRLDVIRARQRLVEALLIEYRRSWGETDSIIKDWRYELGILTAVIECGEQLLDRVTAMGTEDADAYNWKLHHESKGEPVCG